jgi:hypothetical protein
MQFGVVTIDGQQYVERLQIFPLDLTIDQNFRVFTQQRVSLPGVANFLLKGLTRDVTINGVSQQRRFKFRLGNSDGNTWYFSGGLGAPSERVLDTNCFGTGQFPYPIVPPIAYSAGANIQFEVEDVSGQAPYIISFAFHGAYLIPVGSAAAPSGTGTFWSPATTGNQ